MPRKYERLQRKAIRSFRYLTANEESKNRARAEELAISVFSATCDLVRNTAFRKSLRAAGIERVPKLLDSDERTELHFSLRFLVAWTFFRSIRNVDGLSGEIDEYSPGLVEKMNEAFIDLVVHGPFPPPMLLCDLRELVDESSSAKNAKKTLESVSK